MGPVPLAADSFSYAGWTAGSFTNDDDVQILAATGLAGLGQPERETNLSDRQGHGREPGAQWALERRITATVWARDIATVLMIDATMVPRPDPTDELEWVGNFLGLGEHMCRVRPERCAWSYDLDASIGLFRIELEWVAARPTIYSAAATTATFASAAAFHDVTATNAGTVTGTDSWSLILTASGAVSDPYVQIQGDSGRDGESVRFVGLSMTNGQTLTVDRLRVSRLGLQLVDGRARSRGQRVLTWPELRTGAQTVRVGAVSGTVTAIFAYRSTWGVG